MEIEILKKVIATQKEELDEKFKNEKIILRNGIDYSERFLKYPNIFVILGVRRCGKSVFSELLSSSLKYKSGYINFVDERIIQMKTEDLDKIIQAFHEIYGDIELYIFDEIQNIYGWELFLNRLRRTKKVIVTGSNSKLLSGELATHLTGRHIEYTLYPFSFKEITENPVNIYSTKNIAEIRNKLKEYIETSGFPEYKKFGKEIIKEIYDDAITKDCIIRHKIRDEKSFREIASYLISNFSQEFSYSKLSGISSVKDKSTIKNYVNYLKEAYLIIVLERFSYKLKEQIIAPKKIYPIDHGFSNFISFNIINNFGRLFENIVCVELFRRKSENSDMEIYYWKNHQQRECDFLIKLKNNIIQIIQVCYDITNNETKIRELDSLITASNELKCKNLLVITNDKEASETYKGKKIKYIPLWKWLLEEKSGI